MIEEFKGTQNGVKNHVNTLETGVKPRQPEWRFDDSQFQEGAFLQRAKASLEKHKARLEAMTPQEREARQKRSEEEQRKWDYGTTPEGKRDFVAFFINSLKKQGRIAPDLDHLWLNLPSGWAEYREVPAKEANGAPTSTVTLGRTPTQKEWDRVPD